MGLARLDASWRRRYVEQVTAGVAEDECIFCELAIAEIGAASGVVDRSELCFVALNAYPYGSGHVLVLPIRHLAAMGELTEAEAADLWRQTRRSLAAIEAAYAPDGANLGANLGSAAGAGIPGHLHLHVLPRWSGDTNFMTSVGETRVLPESLETSFTKLRAAFAAL